MSGTLLAITQIPLNSFPPNSPPFVKVHTTCITLTKAVNRLSQVLPQPLIFDFSDGIHIRLEGEDNRLGGWQSM